MKSFVIWALIYQQFKKWLRKVSTYIFVMHAKRSQVYVCHSSLSMTFLNCLIMQVINYYSTKGVVASLHAEKPPKEVTSEVKMCFLEKNHLSQEKETPFWFFVFLSAAFCASPWEIIICMGIQIFANNCRNNSTCGIIHISQILIWDLSIVDWYVIWELCLVVAKCRFMHHHK